MQTLSKTPNLLNDLDDCRAMPVPTDLDAFLGLDIGSTTVKAVLLDGDLRLLAAPVYLRSLGHPVETLAHALSELGRGFGGLVRVGITGSGREILRESLELPTEATLTEINAQASGAWHSLPGVRAVIDIGGQDNKCIWLQSAKDGGFSVVDFAMNDLCAAGTGAFLEMHARELGFDSIATFAACATKARRPAADQFGDLSARKSAGRTCGRAGGARCPPGVHAHGGRG